ncbi:MAG: hypothetical protein R3D85_12800 [Paracoccaceae bacterium]
MYFIGYAMAVSQAAQLGLPRPNKKNAIKAYQQWRSSWRSRAKASPAMITSGHRHPGDDLGDLLRLSRGRHRPDQRAALRRHRLHHLDDLYPAEDRAAGTQSTFSSCCSRSPAAPLFAGGARAAVAALLLVLVGVARIIARMQADGARRYRCLQPGNRHRPRPHRQDFTSGAAAFRAELPAEEMAYSVGRKHAVKLRVIALVCAVVLPVAVLLMFPVTHVTGVIAIALHLIPACSPPLAVLRRSRPCGAPLLRQVIDPDIEGRSHTAPGLSSFARTKGPVPMKKVILTRLQTIPVQGVYPDLVMSGMIVERELAFDDGKTIIPLHPEGFKGDAIRRSGPRSRPRSSRSTASTAFWWC